MGNDLDEYTTRIHDLLDMMEDLCEKKWDNVYWNGDDLGMNAKIAAIRDEIHAVAIDYLI